MLQITNNEHWLEQQVKKNANKIVAEKSGEKYSYSEILEITKKVAALFYEKGISQNNHVAILSNNSIEFLIVVNALWLLGSVPVPINLRLKHDEINKLILHSECTAVVNINTSIELERINCKNKIDFFLPLSTESKKNATIDFQKRRTALLMYSSGSTGMPKCVELTFENLYSSVESFQAFTNSTDKDIWLASLPFYHIGGFSIITRSLLIGNKIVIPESFSVKDLLKVFNESKPSYFSVVPTVMDRLLSENIKPWNNLKAVFIGGGPVSEKLVTGCIKTNWPIVKVYGATETASMVTAINANELKRKPASAGKPLKNVKIKIIDGTGTEQPIGLKGEIVIEANSVAKGYFNSDNNKIEEKKYFTNDSGSIDSDGYLYVYGRLDDTVISGGENFNLNEIKEYVKSLDIIEDCATLKVLDKTWGESYLLIVEAKAKRGKVNSEIIEKNILNGLKANIAKYKHPKKIILINKIPRNELGKLNIVELKKIIEI